MKPVPIGHEQTLTLQVTEKMTVDFEGVGKLHPVYATYWLVKHLELVSRKLLEPFLEPGEDAIGFEVSARHVSSALPGMTLTFSARFERQEGKRVYCSCQAASELDDLIGTGQTTQVVLPKERLQAGFKELRARLTRHQQA